MTDDDWLALQRAAEGGAFIDAVVAWTMRARESGEIGVEDFGWDLGRLATTFLGKETGPIAFWIAANEDFRESGPATIFACHVFNSAKMRF